MNVVFENFWVHPYYEPCTSAVHDTNLMPVFLYSAYYNVVRDKLKTCN